MLAMMGLPAQRTPEMIPMMRESLDQMYTAELSVQGRSITHEEKVIPGPRGEIKLAIFRPANHKPAKGGDPGVYYMHGGGMISGNRFLGVAFIADYIEQFNVVCVSVEYGLAPEHPAPAPIEDSYAGLKWMGENLAALNINPERLMVAGQSAGACLAAGLALLVRDRGGPKLCAQLLICPMLDDRTEKYVSNKQFPNEGTWPTQVSNMAWKLLLGDRVGTNDVSIYSAPGRATDLAGLPPAWIDVGSAEVFRDEAVDYASRLWAAGVQAELHVWGGAWHGFDLLLPSAALSKEAIKTRTGWVRATLASPK